MPPRMFIGQRNFEPRLVALENSNATNWTEFWQSHTSGSSGTITPATGYTIVLDQWPGGVDAVVEGITGGVPDGQPVYTAAGALVTVTALNGATGDYTLSGTPDTLPCAITYAARVTAKTILGYYDTRTDFAPTVTGSISLNLATGNAKLIDASGISAGQTLTVTTTGWQAGAVKQSLEVIIVTGANIPTLTIDGQSVSLSASKEHWLIVSTRDNGTTKRLSPMMVF